ncbi:MAG: hypothetical protein WEB63_04675 [Cucumibacter sp.]
MRVLTAIAALMVGVIAIGTAVGASAMTPTGIWEATNGESRYAVSLCGDRTQLCAYLIWIDPDVLDDNNRKYLNRSIFRFLNSTGPHRWEGEITVEGRAVSGVVELVSANELRVTACVLAIVCSSGIMPRIGN